jgi:hypothetical protein
MGRFLWICGFKPEHSARAWIGEQRIPSSEPPNPRLLGYMCTLATFAGLMGWRAHGIGCQDRGCEQPRPELSMTECKRMSLIRAVLPGKHRAGQLVGAHPVEGRCFRNRRRME